MKTLIVGGTRFLGAAIARELVRRGHEVTLLHRGHTDGDVPGQAEHVFCDARDRARVEAHLSTERYDMVFDTILQAADLAWMLPLLERTAGGLIHCGSTGVYAPAPFVPSRETDPVTCPEELGGFSEKLAQDEAVAAFHRQTGFFTSSLRISNVFGAWDVPLDGWGARNPAYFQRIADHKEVWIPERGLPLLQPVHVDDLARGFCDVMDHPDKTAGEIFNLSSDRAVTLNEYFQITRELLHSNSPRRHASMEEILATGKANESGLRFVCEHMCIDSSKAAKAFGYRPLIGAREGLLDSLRWMVQRGVLQAQVGD
jgi:nucleoside-diphosphate-sugar epimerase